MISEKRRRVVLKHFERRVGRESVRHHETRFHHVHLGRVAGQFRKRQAHALRQYHRREVQGREQVVGLLSVGRIFLPLDGAHDFLGELPRAEQFRRRKRLGKPDVLQFPDRQPGLPVPLLLGRPNPRGND
jgi:hypothetical protein